MFEYSLFKPKQFSYKFISNFLFKLITEEKRCFDRDSISQRPQVQQIRWSNCETVSTTVATNQEGLQRKSSLWEKLKCAARGLFPAPNCKWPPKPLHHEAALFLYTRRTTGGLTGRLAAVAHASLGGAARSPPPAPTLPVCGACGAGKTFPGPTSLPAPPIPEGQRGPRVKEGPSSRSALFTWSQGRGQAGRARERVGDAGAAPSRPARAGIPRLLLEAAA